MLKDTYESALRFSEFLERAQKNADLWRDTYRLVRVPPDAVERAERIPGRWHLLVMVEDWCGDAVNTVPLLARLAELVESFDLRIVGRDESPELMNSHLTNGSRSIPVVMVLDEDFVEHGWWGPRPSELQAWVLGPGQEMEKAERYRQVRTWYARDRGRTTADEVLTVIERAAERLATV
jgi:hypothetical protein